MADAHLKSRPSVAKRLVTIQQSQRYRRNRRIHTVPPLYPWWTKLSGRWVEQAWFKAG